MRPVAGGGRPPIVERHASLDRLEVDGATIATHALAQGANLVKRAQRLGDPLVQHVARTVKKRVDLVVAEASCGADG